MPYGKGTYGKTVGRPKKRTPEEMKKMKGKMKRASAKRKAGKGLKK